MQFQQIVGGFGGAGPISKTQIQKKKEGRKKRTKLIEMNRNVHSSRDVIQSNAIELTIPIELQNKRKSHSLTAHTCTRTEK